MAYQLKNISVLLVETNPEMAQVTRMALSAFGINNVYVTYDIEKAFTLFCEHRPDLVMTDWLKEPEGGLALTKRIRLDKASPDSFVPIILMTGYSTKKRVLMARDAGVTEILVKPFTAKALALKIEQIIENPRAFVVSDHYTGPDRRHGKDDAYKGPERRKKEQPPLQTHKGEKDA